MSVRTEWAIFRKHDPMDATPFDADKRYSTEKSARGAIRSEYIDGSMFLEPRSREVSDWRQHERA